MIYRRRKVIALFLSGLFMILLLAGCSSSNDNNIKPTETTSPTETVIPTPDATAEAENNNDDGGNSSSAFWEPTVLTEKQANSINMLNYLASLTREILAKTNSRVFVEQAYDSLINNLNPSKVDELTQSHFNELLDDLYSFSKLINKRDRLKYLYEQNQAQAMRSAIPNPLGLLSAVQSGNLFSLATSVAYMAIDSISSYSAGMSSAEQEYLQGSWALDDEETDTIHSLRKQTFMYMLEVSRMYSLPDELTLSEEKVDSFIEWKEKPYDISSPSSKVLFYQNHEKEYEGFGQYWLARATAHYDNKEWENCLLAIKRYENLQIGIYRKDYDLAKILPIAIASAKEVYTGEQYINEAARYTDLILRNTSSKDWSLRYFAAQTYVDLYNVSKDTMYIDKAYHTVLDNVNELKAEQRRLNSKYLSPIELEPIPAGTDKEKEERIKKYNDQLKNDRGTELPPVYEPLRLNCDLLFALMDEFNYSDTSRQEVEKILFDSNATLFITQPLNTKYSQIKNQPEWSIQFTGKDITLPAVALSPTAAISITVYSNDETTLIDDWTITKVERKGTSADSFVATYHSKTAESFNYADANKLMVSVSPLGDDAAMVYNAFFEINNSKTLWVFDNISFVESK